MSSTLRTLGVVGVALGIAIAVPAHAAAEKAAATQQVDLNTATAKELEALPGVGAATAKKIIAGRPYTAVADLARAGVPAKTITEITPLVTAGKAAAPAAAPPAAASTSESRAAKPARAATAPAGPVDLNTASQKDLEALPAVGAATAKKIIAGRPYTVVADLAKAGVPAKTITEITPLVTVSAPAASRPAAPAPMAPAPAAPAPVAPAPAPVAAAPVAPAPAAAAPAGPVTSAAPAATTPVQQPTGKGMVWVNTSTKVYHREGDPWYGKTKHGKYMSEPDAIAAGYHASKEPEKKKQP